VAYVYRHIRLDKNEPFYIGIGKSGDKNYYRAYVSYRRNKMWHNIVNKTKYDVEIIFEHEDYDFIKQKEIEFINLYGRRQFNTGSLVNMTKGGDGVVGRFITDELRKKLSENKTGDRHPMYGKHHRQETKDKIGLGNAGKKRTLEQLERISKSLKGRKAPNKGMAMPKHQYEAMLKNVEKIKKKVIKYNIDGLFIGIYNSVIDAAREHGIQQGNITNACNKHIMYGGFLWRYMTYSEYPLFIEKYELKVKAIIQYTIDGDIVCEYKSAMDAARANGWVKTTILRALKRRNNIAYNYKWCYKNEKENRQVT